jgi:hypothetical protein
LQPVIGIIENIGLRYRTRIFCSFEIISQIIERDRFSRETPGSMDREPEAGQSVRLNEKG